MLKQLARRWGQLSVQHKISLLCAVFILPMLVVIGVLFSEFYFYHAQTHQILSDYGSCLDYLEAIRSETELMERMAYLQANTETLTRCTEMRQASDRYLEALIDGAHRDNEDVMRIKQVLERAMQSYRARQTSFLRALEAGSFDAQTFSDLQAQGEYLCSYADTLTDTLLREGQTTYLGLGQQLARRNMVLILLVVLCALGMAAGVTLLVFNIVSPVRRLRDAAQQVARGEYDHPDLQYRQTDEIGQMAASFNEMKHQITKTIHALESEAQMEKDLRRHEAEEARLSQLVEHSRFAQLQSQINPHFLFNTLQNIANMAELEQAAVSEDMILRLSKFFRYTLENDEPIVTLARELDLLRDYISLQELRFGERVSFEMDCEPACGEYRVPKFILQPLVENAIVHGMRQRSAGGRIRITSRGTPEGCCVTITDNGCGFDPSAAANPRSGHASIGLDNIAARVRMMHGTLHIFSRPGWGTAARIRIPKGGNEHDQDSGR